MNKLRDFASGFGKGFKEFGQNIAVIVNTILLSVVYLVGVGITSLIAKLMHKRFLDINMQSKAKTYWSDLNLKKKPTNEYYRQF